MITPSAAPTRRVGPWLAGGLAAFILGLVALAADIATAEHLLRVRQAQCEHLFQPITATMPWYALPLGITATALFVASALLGLVAYRHAHRTGSGALAALSVILIAAGVLATILALWFGVYAVIADTPINPRRCVG
jgi:hypothetical protein